MLLVLKTGSGTGKLYQRNDYPTQVDWGSIRKFTKYDDVSLMTRLKKKEISHARQKHFPLGRNI